MEVVLSHCKIQLDLEIFKKKIRFNRNLVVGEITFSITCLKSHSQYSNMFYLQPHVCRTLDITHMHELRNIQFPLLDIVISTCFVYYVFISFFSV